MTVNFHTVFIKKRSRCGMALYLVMAVVLIMGLIMPIQFSLSRQLSFSSFTQLNEERLASITRIVHNVAYAYIRTSVLDPKHRITKFFTEAVKTTTTRQLDKLDEEPDLQKILLEAIPEAVTIDDCKFKIKARIFNQTDKNAEGFKYYPGEGLGTIEITVEASLYRGRTFLSSCRYVRHYDFKSTCLVAASDDVYTMGFPLKFALLVRDGHKESGETDTNSFYSLPDENLRITGNGGDVYIGFGQKITTNGNYLAGLPPYYNAKNTRLADIGQKGPSGFRPFRHCSLYAARFNGADSFLRSGIYNKKTGELCLPGLVDIQNAPLNLPKPENGGKIKVTGKGGLLVPEGITLNCGIELNNKDQDMCILFTRKGNIHVKTTDTIEAALLAFGDKIILDCGIKSDVPDFKIRGCLGVDRLFAHSKPFRCEIDYDKRFKAASANDEIFCISLIPLVRFEHKEFSRLDILI